jgi:hypothetical protein
MYWFFSKPNCPWQHGMLFIQMEGNPGFNIVAVNAGAKAVQMVISTDSKDNKIDL